jgi:hypothetical protein
MLDGPMCRKCASRQVSTVSTTPDAMIYRCNNCGREWTVVERQIDPRKP